MVIRVGDCHDDRQTWPVWARRSKTVHGMAYSGSLTQAQGDSVMDVPTKHERFSRIGAGSLRAFAMFLALVGESAWTEAIADEAKPVPQAARIRAEAFRVDQTGTGGAIVRLYDETVGEYIVDRANKPFLWRLAGPTGKSMTRSFPMADVTGETTDHVHQRGLTFGHQGVGGFDTWSEAASIRDPAKAPERVATLGAIRHRGFRTLAGGPTGVIHARNDIVDASNKPLLAEERRMTFSFGPSTRVIDIDIDLIAEYGPVELADMKDAGLSIRVPDSMTVDRGLGGTIVNSSGQRDADAWSKKAFWVDYHGPVEGDHLGIAFLNHPTSFRHPTTWHVRTYGLFCANPFGMKQMNPEAESGAVSFAAGQRISLRHRVIFHVGDEQRAGIAAAYEAYAAETPAPLATRDVATP